MYAIDVLYLLRKEKNLNMFSTFFLCCKQQKLSMVTIDIHKIKATQLNLLVSFIYRGIPLKGYQT